MKPRPSPKKKKQIIEIVTPDWIEVAKKEYIKRSQAFLIALVFFLLGILIGWLTPW